MVHHMVDTFFREFVARREIPFVQLLLGRQLGVCVRFVEQVELGTCVTGT